MSHVSQFCTEIVVNSKSVMDTLMACAVELGATIKNGMTVRGHTTHEISNGFVAVIDGVDVGVTAEKEKLTFYADTYHRPQANDFMDKLKNKFRNKCIQTALEEEGFQVEVQESPKEVIFTGVG